MAIAMWVMSAISGLMGGSQIFRAKDAPFYKIGVVIMIAMVAFGLVVVGLQMAVYALFNRRLECEESREINASFEGKVDSTSGSGSSISCQKWAKKREAGISGRIAPYTL